MGLAPRSFAAFLAILTSSLALPLAAQAPQPARQITVNIDDPQGPVDRFFDLSVGSDYPGTLMRDNS